MSAEAVTKEAFEAGRAGERHALAFRIAFAAAAGLTLGKVLGWDFPFLPPLLAVQLLTGPAPLNLKQGFGFVAAMTAACGFSVLVAQIFADVPIILILVLALLVFLGFLMLARGQAVAVAAIFLITISVVPLLAITSLSLAYGLVFTLIAGSFLAVLLSFLAYALFPAHAPLKQDVPPPAEVRAPVAAALANATVLTTLVIYFMLTASPVSVIVLMTAITILRQSSIAGPGVAFGFIIGNVAGGLAATIAYLLVFLLPSAGFLLLVTLLAGLIFGAKIAEGGQLAPVYTVGLVTFLIVLGLGLSPLPQDSGAIFLTRVANVVLAAVYAIGMASVLRALFRAN